MLDLHESAQSYTMANTFKTDADWISWKETHQPPFSDDLDESRRYVIWQANVRLVTEHNKHSSFTLEINKFSHLTNTEFQERHGYKISSEQLAISEPQPTFEDCEVPDEIDWRDSGYVTHVKNQGNHKTCYAFSATGGLEGQMFKETGKLVSLSEQQLVDCSSDFGNGDQGGLMTSCFKYIKASGGIDSEINYSYKGPGGPCRYNKGEAVASVTGTPPYIKIKGNEQALKKAVGCLGPICVAIDASHPKWHAYKHGVYHTQTYPVRLNHAVLVVGYGKEWGQDYWLVKNSYGTNWGENGYIKMARNCNNLCGIASDACYPRAFGLN